MKFPRTYQLSEIAGLIDVPFIGPESFPVTGMNEIHVVGPGDIVFVDHPKYYEKALQSAATVVLINKEVDCPAGKALLISEDPFRDFNALTRHFRPFFPEGSAISASAEIGQGTSIGPNVCIGSEVRIGRDCVIHPNVTIRNHCILGDRVVVQSGTVIGSDAFYYKKRPEGFDRLLSGGRVVLEDDVELDRRSRRDVEQVGELGASDRGAGHRPGRKAGKPLSIMKFSVHTLYISNTGRIPI